MRQDPGALHSWLEMDIIDRMQNEGLISQDEFSAIAQGLVDAYNEGRLPQQQAETFLQVASLQQAAPGIVDTQFTQMREFLAASGASAATRTSRENFSASLHARALTRTCVVQGNSGYVRVSPAGSTH